MEFFRTKRTSKICKTTDAEVLAIQRGRGLLLAGSFSAVGREGGKLATHTAIISSIAIE